MKAATLSAGAVLLMGTVACEKPDYIERTRMAHLTACPHETIDQIVGGYLGPVRWSAYPTGDDDLIRVKARGTTQIDDASTDVELEFLYRESTREAILLRVRYNEHDQMQSVADTLIETMCETSRAGAKY